MDSILPKRLQMGGLLLLFFLIASLGYSQGHETFTDIPTDTPGSYSTRDWTGDNGVVWNATNVRTDLTINGKAITFHKSNSGELTATISGGIGNLTLTTERKYGNGAGTISVSINGNIIPSTFPFDGTVQTTEISGINEPGEVVLVLTPVASDKRVAIDDLIWTAFEGGGGNTSPFITNITQLPSDISVTSSDDVMVSADIIDGDGIDSAELHWGIASGSLTNTIAMSFGAGDTYALDSAIPAQADGTTVYYEIEATDNHAEPATSTSLEQSYTVADPIPFTIPYSNGFGNQADYDEALGFGFEFNNATQNGSYVHINSGSIISPAIDFSAYSSLTASFKLGTFGGGGGELSVFVSDDNGANYTLLDTFAPDSSTPSAFEQIIDLTSLSVTDGRIKFEQTGGTNSIRFNTLTIEETPPYLVQFTSFESSEGFQLGQIHGQKGWAASDPTMFTVTDEDASDGGQSVRIGINPASNYRTLANYLEEYTSGKVSFSADIKIVDYDGGATEIMAYGGGNITTRVSFQSAPARGIPLSAIVLDHSSTDPSGQTSPASVPINENEWFNIDIVYDFVAGNAETVEYFINGVSFYNGPITWAGTTADIFAIYALGEEEVFIDNIRWGMVCDDPTDLIVDTITHNAANVSWTAGTNNGTDFEVVYAEAGFNPNSAGTIIPVTNGDTEINLSGLTENTDYDVYVRANCGDNKNSHWVGPNEFTTRFDLVQFTSFESSEGFVLGQIDGQKGWSAEDPTMFEVTDEDASDGTYSVKIGVNPLDPPEYRSLHNNFEEYTTGKVSFSVDIKINNYDGGATEIAAFTSGDDITTRVSFQTAPARGIDVLSALVLDKDSEDPTGASHSVAEPINENEWVNLDVVYDFVAGSAESVEYFINGASIYSGPITWDGTTADVFAIYAIGKEEVFIDNIRWGMICDDPTDLIVDTITHNAANVSWTAGTNNGTDFEVVYEEASFNPNSAGTIIPVTGGDTDIILSGLAENTDYDVYVRANCSDNKNSHWVGPVTFNTLPTPYVYQDGEWTPNHPSMDATDADDITIVDGNADGGDSFYGVVNMNNLNIMPGASLEVNGVMNVHGDLNIDGDLVFVSDSNGNGELGIVGGTITGEATVQSYMSNNRSYRMVSSAVTTTGSVYDNWQEGGIDTNAGFGTHITGDQDGLNGFDATATGNPSMFTVDYSATPNAFAAVPDTDVNTLNAGTPYLLFVRGDRSIDLGENSASGETVLRATGTLEYGAQDPQTFPTVSAGEFAMFGNPYQSAVDINNLFEHGATNVNDAHYYVYDPTLADHGKYVTVNLTPGSGTNTDNSDANQYLQPGQGAQFATSGIGGSTLVFTEANKAPGNFTITSATGNQLSSDNMLTVQLYTTENFSNGGSTHDSFGIIFGDGLNNEVTNADAVKPMNFYENLGRDHNGTYLSLERREMPQPAEVYPLYSSGYSHADYTLKMSIDGLEETFLYLDDHYTGTSTLLEDGETVYTFSVDADDAWSIATDRFSIRTEQRLGVDSNGMLAGVRLFPNPLNGDTFYINAPKLNGEQLSVSISDLTGRSIYEQTLNCNANTVTVPMGSNMASGVYLVTLKHGGESNTYRLIKE